IVLFFYSSRRRHTRFSRDWSSDVCSSDLDLVEFANGGVDTPWGRLRAEMGHPEPFNMKYLGIGNEQWGPEYFERYKIFAKAFSRSEEPSCRVRVEKSSHAGSV